MDLTARTGVWLKNNNIIVNNDWLQACVEWIHEDNQSDNLSEDELRNSVYEQWLLADLHELETACLPQGIQNMEKLELNGAYALQIDSIVDVGTSFYSQQVKIKGKENANVHVTADDPNLKPWEPKPSRMLLFKLTDGTINIQGMEYTTITCLNQETHPGTKIIVHGKVLCRHGILMLSEQNIKHLGGEVDTLVETNTMTQVLQSAMESSEEHASKNHRQTFTGSAIRRNGQHPGNQSRQSYSGRNDVTQSGLYGNKMKIEPVSQVQVSGMQMTNRNKRVAETGDGFSDDDDFLEDMNVDDFQPIQTNRNTYKTANMANDQSTSIKTEQKQDSIPITSHKPSIVHQTIRNNHVNNSSEMSHSKVTSISKAPAEFEDFDEMDFEDELEAEYLLMEESANKKTVSSKQTVNVRGNQSQLMSSKTSTLIQSDQSSNSANLLPSNREQSSVVSVSKIKNENNSKHKDAEVSNLNVTKRVDQPGVSIKHNISDNCSVNQTDQNLQVKTFGSTLRESGLTNISNSTDLSNKRKQPTSIESFFPSKVQNIITEEKTAEEKKVEPDVDLEYPFTYLSKVMSKRPPDQPSYYTVKAYISTLTSKLSSADGKWTLSCKINDGTMAVDVDLSDKVLTELIGFSTKESVVMRQKMKTNPSVKKILQEGIKQCQQNLINLMCLLELEICAKNTRPIIVAKKQVNRHHIDMLYNRVMASWNK